MTTKTNSPTNFQKEKKVFKVIVVGDSSVGKTCLTYRFCEGVYLDKPEATIGVDFRERVLNIGGEEIKLQLWDTAGQERFRKSMSVPVWLEECEQHSLTSQLPRILVGNKCDCVESLEVSTSLAQRLADAHNMPLFETSAQSESEGSNIEAIFVTLAHKLVKQQPMMTVPMDYENMQRANVISVTRSQDSSSDGCTC